MLFGHYDLTDRYLTLMSMYMYMRSGWSSLMSQGQIMINIAFTLFRKYDCISDTIFFQTFWQPLSIYVYMYGAQKDMLPGLGW